MFTFSLSPLALNEAVCGGNPELIGLLMRHRDQQQAKARAQDIPLLLERLQSTQDYYIEMKWEFSSWSECCDGRGGVEGEGWKGRGERGGVEGEGWKGGAEKEEWGERETVRRELEKWKGDGGMMVTLPTHVNFLISLCSTIYLKNVSE